MGSLHLQDYWMSDTCEVGLRSMISSNIKSTATSLLAVDGMLLCSGMEVKIALHPYISMSTTSVANTATPSLEGGCTLISRADSRGLF